MTKIKINSNPYIREISYSCYNQNQDIWEDICISNANSALRNDQTGKSFLPFKIKEIVNTIIDEYHTGNEPVEIVFEGTQDEYDELQAVCQTNDVRDLVHLSRSYDILENARIIFKPTKEIFQKVEPIIKKIVKDDTEVIKKLNKVSDALKDIIPICVFGNYSTGKSTFINALIGSEVLPSGIKPVTAKIYKIERSPDADVARIRYSLNSEEYELLFEDTNFRILRGADNNKLFNSIKNEISSLSDRDMSSSVNKALELINRYEKENEDNIDIGSIINVEFPFSRKGILGQSYNNFVIFDTPGSNSTSNADHSTVLAEALDGFSNGIPVWVSLFNTLDSTDNTNLCEKVLGIQALDRRFTMIVINQADSCNLTDLEDDFPTESKKILEYSSVEKMYSSGIYFVSSIMGLGYKNGGKLKDKFYSREYKKLQNIFNDADYEDYSTLFKYNIMPEQIKNKVIEYSKSLPDSECVYSKSGLYCIEQEMENFGSKYAAYNKCQMVFSFLSEVINETDRRITERTEILKRQIDLREDELEDKRKALINQINNTSNEKEKEYETLSTEYSRDLAQNNSEYLYDIETIENLASKLHKKYADERSYSSCEKDVKDSASNMFSNLKKNGDQILKQEIHTNGFMGVVRDSINKASILTKDFTHDLSSVIESRNSMKDTNTEIDKHTSDELLEIVKNDYKSNVMISKDILNASIKEHWSKNADMLRDVLVQIITGSDALQTLQREELKNIIMNYQPIEFVDDSDNIFIKGKFLSGTFFGITLSNSEKLNISRLTKAYNKKIKETMSKMSCDINTSCIQSFIKWKEGLHNTIEEHIIEYNPQLRAMSDMIREEKEKIEELTDNQKLIKEAHDAINELMSWKSFEQE